MPNPPLLQKTNIVGHDTRGRTVHAWQSKRASERACASHLSLGAFVRMRPGTREGGGRVPRCCVRRRVRTVFTWGDRATFFCLLATWTGTQCAGGVRCTHTCDCCPADPQSGVAPGLTRGRNVRSRYRCSMCPAIHINSRSWLRSSSTHEPSDPPPKVVFLFVRFCFGCFFSLSSSWLFLPLLVVLRTLTTTPTFHTAIVPQQPATHAPVDDDARGEVVGGLGRGRCGRVVTPIGGMRCCGTRPLVRSSVRRVGKRKSIRYR